jgi:hypothetical protein
MSPPVQTHARDIDMIENEQRNRAAAVSRAQAEKDQEVYIESIRPYLERQPEEAVTRLLSQRK